MKVDVYDTYAFTAEGTRLHFDVLVPHGEGDKAPGYALSWVKRLNSVPANITLDRCSYCHSEEVTQEVATALAQEGYSIVELAGCPNPDA